MGFKGLRVLNFEVGEIIWKAMLKSILIPPPFPDKVVDEDQT